MTLAWRLVTTGALPSLKPTGPLGQITVSVERPGLITKLGAPTWCRGVAFERSNPRVLSGSVLLPFLHSRRRGPSVRERGGSTVWADISSYLRELVRAAFHGTCCRPWVLRYQNL